MKTLLTTTLFASTLVLAGAAAQAADKEIAVIVKTANSDFWQNVKKGSTAAASEMKGYSSTFDLWSTGGQTVITNSNKWVHNWGN